jgi:hypothetical protein
VAERAHSLFWRKFSSRSHERFSVSAFDNLSVGSDNGLQSRGLGLLARLHRGESAEKVAIVAAGLALVARWAGFRALGLSAARLGFAALFGAARSFNENILGLELSKVFLYTHGLGLNL